MCSNWLKYLISLCLLVIYINRGLFVAMPGIETSRVSVLEINSLLEVVMNLAGGHNEIDEDGDAPESYGGAKSVQPLINHNHTYASLTCPYEETRKIFYTRNDAMLPSGNYKTIEKPPEELKIENSVFRISANTSNSRHLRTIIHNYS